MANIDLRKRTNIIRQNKITTLFDVGANQGQYAAFMRSAGYNNKIISFEPIKSQFSLLKRNSQYDKNWHVYNCALGNSNGSMEINISGNGLSNSLLDMLPLHITNAPDSIYVDKETIEIKRLDSIFHEFLSDNERIMVKIDTQGFEKKVLEGAMSCMQHIAILQVEMSISPLYEGESTFIELLNYLGSMGFAPFSFKDGFSSPITGQLLQVDGFFLNLYIQKDNSPLDYF